MVMFVDASVKEKYSISAYLFAFARIYRSSYMGMNESYESKLPNSVILDF